jgi:hypothetical protein
LEVIQILAWPLPSTSLPSHHSLNALSFDVICCWILTPLLSKQCTDTVLYCYICG